MAILKVARLGHPVLREKSLPVPIDEIRSPEIQRLIDDLVETMREYNGAGLAAPQVGVQKRLFVYDIGDGADVLVNPVIDESRGEWTFEEGCLSVPELSWPIVRPKEVHLTGFDLEGNEVSLEADELLARLFQHELDHLDGVLLLQHLEPDQQKEARRILRQRALGLPVDPPQSERAGAL